MRDTSQRGEPSTTDADSTDSNHASLRGSFTAVMLMAAFFAITWFGMLALAWSRR